jgi:hypothetical protein
VSGAADLARWLQTRFREPEPALVAVEVRSRAVGVVRVAREGNRSRVAAAASLELPAGALAPSVAQANVKDPAALQAVLRAALERTGVLGGARVALVVPDPAVRVALLPASELPPGKPSEVEEVVRFKLRKTLPFEVKDAAVSVGRGPGASSPAVVAVMPHAVLREYEVACESLALHPGLVVPSGLALASAVGPGLGGGDHVLLNWDHAAASIVVLRDGWPLLVRTFVGEGAVQPDAVARELASTGVYFTERLGGAAFQSLTVRAAHPDGLAGLDALRMAGLPPVRLADPWAALGGAVDALAQPLAGAAAVLAAGQAA